MPFPLITTSLSGVPAGRKQRLSDWIHSLVLHLLLSLCVISFAHFKHVIWFCPLSRWLNLKEGRNQRNECVCSILKEKKNIFFNIFMSIHMRGNFLRMERGHAHTHVVLVPEFTITTWGSSLSTGREWNDGAERKIKWFLIWLLFDPHVGIFVGPANCIHVCEKRRKHVVGFFLFFFFVFYSPFTVQAKLWAKPETKRLKKNRRGKEGDGKAHKRDHRIRLWMWVGEKESVVIKKVGPIGVCSQFSSIAKKVIAIHISLLLLFWQCAAFLPSQK